MSQEQVPALLKRGRTTLKTEATLTEIITRLSEGETLRKICRDSHMPSFWTVYQWKNDDEDFATRFARARLDGADAIAQEALDILDELPERATSKDGDRIDPAHVAWTKNRAEMRLKLLAKWFPQQYGEKLQIDGTMTHKRTKEEVDAELAAFWANHKKRQGGDGSGSSQPE